MATTTKRTAYFRFYGALRDFLSGLTIQQTDIGYSFCGEPAVKDAIEAQGVPHPEVDLILINERPVSFDHPLSGGERVSVYPWIQCLPRPTESLRPALPSPPRFVCDVHLGQLARHLRMLGLNTRYDTDNSDPVLARIVDEERRVLLTRDLGLLKRGRVGLGAFVRAQSPRDQLQEVIERFDLAETIDPLSRCLDCNIELVPAPPDAVDGQVPPHAGSKHDEFVQCPSCDSVFWPGTHVDRMRTLIDDVTSPHSGDTRNSNSIRTEFS